MKIEAEGRTYPVYLIEGKTQKNLSCKLESPHGAKAHIISMSHAANTSFYQEVGDIIENSDGLVLREGYELDTGPETTEVNLMVEYYKSRHEKILKLCEILNLDYVRQKEYLRFPESRTVIADLSMQEYCFQLQKQGFDFDEFFQIVNTGKKRKLIRMFENKSKFHPISILKPSIRFLVNKIILNPKYRYDIKEDLSSKNAKALRKVKHGVRNKRLIKSIIEKTKDSDVIIPWGAAHTKPIVKTLQFQQWKVLPETIKYLTVYDASRRKKEAA